MYLSKKQIKAIELAMSMMGDYLTKSCDPEDEENMDEAITEFSKMLHSHRKLIRKPK